MTRFKLFAAAMGLIALHVVNDSLVSLRPGAQRSDHIAAALIPLAVIAISIWGYPRMRAGGRGICALSFGVPALVGGGLGVAYWIASGISGSAVTGLLLIPAGLLLIGLGVAELWGSRKQSGHWLARRVLIGFAGLVFAFELILPLSLAVYSTHLPPNDPDLAALGSAFTPVTFKAGDGTQLAASWAPSRNGAAIITFPDRGWTDRQSRMLAENGYGVLAVDMRGYGKSEGDPNAFGWGSTQDIDAAVLFAALQPSVEPGKIGGLGLSVGGEKMIDAAATNPALRAIVAEGAGERSVAETWSRGPAAFLVIPQQAVQTAAVAALSGESPPPALQKQIAKISPRAVMLIYAKPGQGGEDLNPEYYAAAGQKKVIWLAPGASHTGGIGARPEEYEKRVTEFFEANLRPADVRAR